MTVRAPRAGLVIERNVRLGDLGGGGTTPLYRSAQDGQVELAADVGEDALAKLRPGDGAEVTLADGTRSSRRRAPGQSGRRSDDQAWQGADQPAGALGRPRRRLRPGEVHSAHRGRPWRFPRRPCAMTPMALR